ncbi:DUF6471 domain-containing protein [Agarilytica rhodophyticola]|uniref:DUF6471 domain-containing protein n=1 Tax=Agarilytica rhodophyticola TaxID=1737490 RepID=UPI000B34588C|nr:DUF6471 domain-containing protein [Agarilytica rhodophyticola]
MVERYKDPEMQEVIKRYIRAAMAEENVSYSKLSERLRQVGVIQNESTLRTKVSTGLMTTSLYIHILNALDIDNLSIADLMQRYSRLRSE